MKQVLVEGQGYRGVLLRSGLHHLSISSAGGVVGSRDRAA